MNFNLTLIQEDEINEWLDEQNEKAIQSQLSSPDLDEVVKKRLKDAVESGLSIPHHSIEHGYYTISFTPCPYGNRIFVHHHVTGESAKVQDIEELKEVKLPEKGNSETVSPEEAIERMSNEQDSLIDLRKANNFLSLENVNS